VYTWAGKEIKAVSEEKIAHIPSLVQIWILAARPRTLPAAAAPVIVGAALAYVDGAFTPGPVLAALLAALLLQIGANLANDVFDFHRGADTSARLGPLRVTQAGLLKPAQVLGGMWIAFILAGLLGIYLVIVAGWPVALIGFFSILAAIAYTGGPFPLGYYGLGELFVFLFFGLAAVCGTYFVQAGRVSAAAVWASVPMGLLITAILVVNNLRDIETDRLAGKRTLAVRLGAGGAKAEYVLCLAGAYLTPAAMALLGVISPWGLLSWLTAPLAVSLVRMVLNVKGRPLNRALAGTGQLVLAFGVLFSLGLVLYRIFL
jgi:1,4-dihydroxy-2-naphthoate octaprenyltransferase